MTRIDDETARLGAGLAALAEATDGVTHAGAAEDAASRGRRYRRRRRVGTSVAIGLTVAVLAVLASVQQVRAHQDVAPAADRGGVGLPERLYEPSRWLPGSGEDAPGVLAAVLPADRGSWGADEDGVVGVSAGDGSYRFLDLPDATYQPAGSGAVALAPDGRHVAYWTTGGSTRQAPNRAAGPVTGIAVYDTVTGSVVRNEIESDHGVAFLNLAWVDDDSVVIQYTPLTGVGSSVGRGGESLVWDLGTADPRRVDVSPVNGLAAAGAGLVVVTVDDRRFDLVDLSDPTDPVRSRYQLERPPRYGGAPVIISPDRTTFAAVGADPGADGRSRLLVGPVPEPDAAAGVATDAVGDVELVAAPGGSGVENVLAWVDEDTVAVFRGDDPADPDADLEETRIDLVDVRDGSSRTVVLIEGRELGFDRQLAIDLLGAPTIAAPEPPRPADPRVLTAVGTLAVLACGVVVWVWRRRVRV